MDNSNSNSLRSSARSSSEQGRSKGELSEEDKDWLRDLQQHRGWEVFRKEVHRRLYLPAYSNLRQLSGSSQAEVVQALGQLQGKLDMFDQMFDLVGSVTKLDGGLPR